MAEPRIWKRLTLSENGAKLSHFLVLKFACLAPKIWNFFEIMHTMSWRLTKSDTPHFLGKKSLCLKVCHFMPIWVEELV